MAKRARLHNALNHSRQVEYLRKGVVMLPTIKEEKKNKKEVK